MKRDGGTSMSMYTWLFMRFESLSSSFPIRKSVFNEGSVCILISNACSREFNFQFRVAFTTYRTKCFSQTLTILKPWKCFGPSRQKLSPGNWRRRYWKRRSEKLEVIFSTLLRFIAGSNFRKYVKFELRLPSEYLPTIFEGHGRCNVNSFNKTASTNLHHVKYSR